MNTIYGEIKEKTAVVKKRGKDRKSNYEPSLPTNVVIEDLDMYGMNREEYDKRPKNERGQQYEPPLPTNILNYKSVRGLHQTQKPVELIKWILKYYSKEGWTCLDCCMGSASTGQACKEMNRKFIGIELDDKIFNIAQTRLKGTADQLKELCKKPKRKKKINTEKVLVI
jgi:DNA modification methylase